MPKTKPTVHIETFGSLTMTRYETAQVFECGKCGWTKKSKNVAEWKALDGSNSDVCNACYGEMLAEDTRRQQEGR